MLASLDPRPVGDCRPAQWPDRATGSIKPDAESTRASRQAPASGRAHRHSAAALRLIIKGRGGYTVVNGECVPMFPGDLVLTPDWTWHDHANDTSARQPPRRAVTPITQRRGRNGASGEIVLEWTIS
jgi:hypothetical protein